MKKKGRFEIYTGVANRVHREGPQRAGLWRGKSGRSALRSPLTVDWRQGLASVRRRLLTMRE